MRRLLAALAGLAACAALYHTTLDAQSANASMTVSATVAKNCTITTAAMNFGAYDPVTGNATAPLDGTGTLTVTCTKGASAKIALDSGGNSIGSSRRMRLSALEFLGYEIYKEAARTNVWGNGLTDSLDIGAAPNRNPRTFTAYGRVPGAQDASVGSYTDTVVATVNF